MVLKGGLDDYMCTRISWQGEITMCQRFTKLALLTISFSAHQCGLRADETVMFGTGGNEFSVSFVVIGSTGNAAHTDGAPSSVGSVSYLYRMGKYEISRSMVEKASLAGSLQLTLDAMSHISGIGSDHPATGISWNEAARFVNWLNESKGYPHAYNFAIQPGQNGYNPNVPPVFWPESDSATDSRGLNRFRHKDAKFVLPSVDEWYKAAYFNPTTSEYDEYPCGGGTAPVPSHSGVAAGTAIISQSALQGPAEITQAGGAGGFGVVGMGGNVWEWEESLYSLESYNNDPNGRRATRGGFWFLGVPATSGKLRIAGPTPIAEVDSIGFRVAFVNKPASVSSSQVVHGGWTGQGSAVDTGKSLHKQTSTATPLAYTNLINTTGGVNRLLFKIESLANATALSPADFEFRVSPQFSFNPADQPPPSWQLGPTPTSIQVSTTGSISDVTIVWPDSSIANRWLRVILKANAITGLPAEEIYYIGHLLGETTGLESSSQDYRITQSDIATIRPNLAQIVDASSIFDVDKTGSVQFADIVAARSNLANLLPNLIVP